MLVTIKDYCSQRTVSRQFVYEYIRKGKFEVVELPLFVRFEGKEIEVGKQKFLKDPTTVQRKSYWSGAVSDNDYAKGMAFDATSDEEIRIVLTQYLSLEKLERPAFKEKLYKKYPLGSAKRKELDAAFERCVELMRLEMADIESQLEQLEKAN
jgi:hypothetical protein